MKVVPTCALMRDSDAELALAYGKLESRLADMETELRKGAEVAPDDDTVPWKMGDWFYFGSAPYRTDKGDVAYVHGFRHRTLWSSNDDLPLTMAILATEGWWPNHCRHVAPRRGPARGSLRLVS